MTGYKVSSGKCSAHIEHCKTITNSGNVDGAGEKIFNCALCEFGYYVKDYTDENDQCVECRGLPGCDSCSKVANTYGDCLTCIDGYFLEGNKCSPCSVECSTCEVFDKCTECGTSYYKEYTDATETDFTCKKCDDNCKTCSSSAVTCTSCHADIPDKSALDIETFVCSSPIEFCTNSFQIPCEQCKSGYYLELDGRKCSPCFTNCALCDNIDKCITCQEG